MKDDYIQKYFKKVNKRIDTINNQDAFSTNFRNAIISGKNKFFQKHLLETRVFDGTWVDFIENNLSYIDNIVRNPKSFIREDEDIVPVERAKKTTAKSIRHLASHSQYVKSVTNRGNVIPNKILTSYNEEDLAIYENRFVKTLIDKLVSFVEKRYTTITNLIGTDYLNKFHSDADFQFADMFFKYEMNLSIIKKVNDIEAEQKNFALLERVETLRTQIIGFMNSDFYKSLKDSKPVFSPIQRTNVLMKDPNYHKAFGLWVLLDSYSKLDYIVETKASEDKFSDEYIKNLYDITLMSVTTILANDDGSLGEFKEMPKVIKREKKPKILSSYTPDMKKTELQMENNLINEYYYQEARKLYRLHIDEQVNDGEPFHTALKDVYKQAFRITEAIFRDLMVIPDEIKENPKALLRFRMRNQQALEQIYKYKFQDLKKMEKENLRMKKQIEMERLQLSGQNISNDPKEKYKLQEKEVNIKIKNLEKEALKYQKMVEKEKERLVKLKETNIQKLNALKEKEKERLAKEKAKEKEKERLAKEKEKQKLLKKQKTKKKKAPKKSKKNIIPPEALNTNLVGESEINENS